VKARGGKTPALTPSPLMGATDEVDTVYSTLLDPPTRASQALLKKVCLARDGCRCMLSGIWDLESVREKTQLRPATATQLSHIIPFAMGHYETSSEVNYSYSPKKKRTKR
jgi:hypothetical protein